MSFTRKHAAAELRDLRRVSRWPHRNRVLFDADDVSTMVFSWEMAAKYDSRPAIVAQAKAMRAFWAKRRAYPAYAAFGDNWPSRYAMDAAIRALEAK